MYNRIFTKILDSSIWLEPLATRVVWITFLAAMDEDGMVNFACPANVARRAGVTEEEAKTAIDAFTSPDPNSSDPDNEGRRIEKVPGGYLILNALKYRALFTREIQREQTRARVAKHRKATNDKLGNAGVTQGNETVTERNTIRDKAETETETEANNTKAQAPSDFVEEIPEALKTEAFEESWKAWQQHRKEIRKPLKLTSSRALLAKLAEMGAERSVIAISHSIANGWQGIFEPTQGKLNTTNGNANRYNPDGSPNRNAGTYD